MSGSKTIQNSSNVQISVILWGRNGADPSGGNLPPVTATIAPGKSVSLQYGNDQNPYLNQLSAEENSNGSDIRQLFTCLTRGGPGTLDALFNTNSTLVLGYNGSSFGFALSGHN